MTTDLKQEDFQTKVLNNNSKPVVVEVWASWCHNCKRLEPIFKASSEQFTDKVDFYKLKADDNMELAKSLKIMGVPTLLFYCQGVLIAKKPGVRSQKSIAKILDPLFSYSKEDANRNKHRSLLKKLFG